MMSARRCLAVLSIAVFAGPGWAGERVDAPVVAGPGQSLAWVGDYRITDAHGERRMTVVRDTTRIEYRIEHLPIRVWRRVDDGVELLELFPDRGERVTFSPGDLRARDREPQWAQISSLVDPALREQLSAGRSGKAFGESVQTYRGNDRDDHAIELAWLTTSAMPARYRIEAGAASETIELQSVRRVPAEVAFTATAALHDTDGADQGD